MKRKDGRALAKSTLEALGVFELVESHEPDSFRGAAFATVHSKSLGIVQDARDDFSAPVEIWVSIYVKRPAGQGAAVEDALDELVRVSMRALYAAFYDQAANLRIGPSESGYPPSPIDGKPYRIERFAVRFDDDEE